jgi:hypothetical protein
MKKQRSFIEDSTILHISYFSYCPLISIEAKLKYISIENNKMRLIETSSKNSEMLAVYFTIK